MQHQELVRRDSELGVCSTVVIAELDFVGTVKQFHDGANLTTHESVLREIREQRDNVQ